MDKGKLKKILLVLGIGAMLFGAAVIYASPGTSKDPLVSLSYMEQHTKFTAIEVKSGTTIIGKRGTEIILRAGGATIQSPSVHGLSDVTAGKDLKNGERVLRNHLLIVPRDGRGVKTTTTATLMIKGEYTIK